ncbi:flippase [Candidatus Chloroploca sp. Khr17]|uniref:flippase n=1 Tax=Candidatus Chloroploca sp. Khr17 TaxID=2496869 RepID=UPI00101C4932|nr:flippase [Candidatus Chloroploca sp. Khr17]
MTDANTDAQTRSSLGRTILRNTLFVSSGGGLIRLLTFAYTILYVRTLGESVYGQYATVLAFGGLFGIFFELGMTQYVERTLAQDRSRLSELLWLLIGVRLLLALAGIGLLPLLALGLGYERVIVLSILVLSLTYVLAAVLAPLMVIFTSHERYDLWTLCQVVGQVGTIAIGVPVLLMGGGLVALVSVGLVVMLLQIVVCLGCLRYIHLDPVHFNFDRRAVPGFLRASLPFALSALALTISFNIDTVLLSLLQPSEVVGWYSAAYKLVPTAISILGGFLTVITPSLARTYVSDRETVHHWTRISIKWLALFALPVAMGTSLLAPQIIALLYGPAFAPAAVVLAVISWDIPLRLFNAFAGNVTAAVGLERAAWRTFMTGALIGVVLYAPAIMAFGMLGAAVVTVLTDGINAILFYRLIGKHLHTSEVGVTLLLVSAATLAMGGVVWGAGQFTILPVTVALGMVSYSILVVMLRLVDRAVVAQVMALIMRRRRVI